MKIIRVIKINIRNYRELHEKSNFKHQESVIKKFLRNFGMWCMYLQFLHHHFSPHLKFIPPSPFSQSVLFFALYRCSFIVLQSLRVIFYILSFLHSTARFLVRFSCTSLTVDISPGHRIPRCLRIPSCLDILGYTYTYTNVHVQSHRLRC